MVEKVSDYEKQKMFSTIKEQVEKIVTDKVNDVFKGYAYNQENAQEYSNRVA
jgi:hypothetical protein